MIPEGKKSVYIAPHTGRIIGDIEQGQLSGRIADIVDRYGESIRRHRAEILDEFTDQELRATAAATLGTVWQPAAAIYQGPAADVADAEPAEIEAFEVDQAELARKLAALSYEQSVALLELLQARAWVARE